MDARILRFVRGLALPGSGAVIAVACGGGQPEPTVPTASSASASSASATTTTVATVDTPADDPTAGVGPCRCSWNTNPNAAPRVCKKGETSAGGQVCQPGNHKKYKYPPVVGPLDPPELS
ncbi:MAG: hypothetical protein JNL79_20110 [Myxococcales bacterium]|nr:hypothetical protein [Myxococcales bacterium]